MKENLGLLVLRSVFAGSMLFTHGISKIASFAERATMFPDPFGIGPKFMAALAIFAEVFCAGSVLIGFKTRWTVFPLITTMSVALFIVHAPDPFVKKELALLYWAGFVTVFCMGPGKYSVDRG